MTTNAQDKKRLWQAAEALSKQLRPIIEGTSMKSRQLRQSATNTDGWRYELARMKLQGIRMELWLDRYPAAQERRFWYGFASSRRDTIRQLVRRAPAHLKPIRTLTIKHTVHPEGVYLVSPPLEKHEFIHPMFEHYFNRFFYFGCFDPAPRPGRKGDHQVVCRARAFFEDMARSLPGRKPEREGSGIYQSIENRTVVRQHLSRERSGVLAEERKIRDGYKCQICGMTFVLLYGDIGRDFAEAHHRVPLSRLRGEVHTTLDDLITVCSNCHRMLHKMDGKANDVAELRRRLRRRKR